MNSGSKSPVAWKIFVGVVFLSFLFAVVVFLKNIAVSSGVAWRKVGVLEIRGIILDPIPVLKEIDELERRKDIAAVVVRLDTPGGGAAASQEIYGRLLELGKSKKVVASLGETAASGGYYIACAAHKIVADPATLTGSIGVIVQFLNFRALLKKLHIRDVTVKSGKNKDIANPLAEIKPEHKKILQEVTDDVHSQFIEAVSKGRGMDLKKVKKLADGRVFTGRQAFKLGLVDKLGGLKTAVEMAAHMAGLRGMPEIEWFPKKKSFLKKVLSGERDVADSFFSGLRSLFPAGVMYLWSSE